jgi:SAM-dependent methyltransferase
MSTETYPTFARYLLAKRSVDDRALNQRVMDRLRAELEADSSDRPCELLDVGGGIGTMLDRLIDNGVIARGNYTLVDLDPALIAVAEEHLAGRTSAGFDISCVTDDAVAFVTRHRDIRNWDLVIAHAFLDLTDIEETVAQLASVVRPGGLLYLTINYDGLTSFLPELDPALDAQIARLYNADMHRPLADGTIPVGSRSGRTLLTALPNVGADVLEAGASDWIVFARDGAYPDQEADFLRHILGFVEDALTNHPELDPGSFQGWLAERHDQVDRGELIYIAHQLDVLARVPKSN